MPIRCQISHPDRMVIGVAQGAITPADIDGFVAELAKAKAGHYRKIIDVMAATPNLTAQDIAAYSERSEKALADRKPGPIAIVTSQEHGPLALLFAQLTSGQRPAKVFRSIHDARKWLQENTPRE